MQKLPLRASYKVVYQCIQMKAAHSTAKNLIKPCAIRMVELALGTEAAKKMKDVPLSNGVIAGRVADMSCDIFDEIVQESKDSRIRINLQLDESTDVFNISQLIVYACTSRMVILKTSFVTQCKQRRKQVMYCEL